MMSLLNSFVHTDLPDVIEGHLRTHIRDLIIAQQWNKEVSFKPPPEYIIDKEMLDPFDTLGISKKTQVQEFVEKHVDDFPKYQAFLYTTSCGSGKTLAGLYAMYKLKCKTLIISTRNAINDQWKQAIEKCFPDLTIMTRECKGKVPDADVYIYSPQYLATKFEDIDLNVSFIIYDEIHSLLSDVFSKVIAGPYKKVLSGDWKQLPYFIGLSATLPQRGTEERYILEAVFGKPFAPKSNITSIPINVWDYRNSIAELKRGILDLNYKPLEDNDFVKFCINKISQEGPIKPCVEYKGMVMTSTIDSSVWAASYIHNVWHTSTIIIRAADEKCIFFEKDRVIPICNTLEEASNAGELCKLYDRLADASVLCGCFHRLKEGFSVENCTWGIITKFVWSISSRVQMLGRIRRYSTSDAINSRRRIFYVCSGKVPNNLYMLKKYSKGRKYKDLIGEAKIDYNFDYEKRIFEKENVVMMN